MLAEILHVATPLFQLDTMYLKFKIIIVGLNRILSWALSPELISRILIKSEKMLFANIRSGGIDHKKYTIKRGYTNRFSKEVYYLIRTVSLYPQASRNTSYPIQFSTL